MIIYKYPLELTDEQQIKLTDSPYNKILSVGFDGHNKLCVWILTPNNNHYLPKKLVTFYIVGTGNPFPPFINLEYIGSVKDNITNPQVTFMWHVFYNK